MGLKLSLNDKADREWLEKRGVNVKTLLDDNKRKAILTLRELEKKPSERLENDNMAKQKYRNTAIIRDGIRFDSKHEYNCWNTLKNLEKLGYIFNLKRQVKVPFVHNGVTVFVSRPDFYFEVEVENSRKIPVYADAKSPITAKLRPFRIAQKMFLAFFGAPMLVFLADTNIYETIIKHKVELS